MQATGRSIVLSVFVLALAMSAGAWWYHYSATRRMARFWGPAAANLLVRGELVDAYLLAPGGVASDAVSLPDWPPPFAKGLEATAVEHVDLTGAKGLIHLRHALTQDNSYDWDAAEVNIAPQWAFAFRFSDGDDATWALLSREFDFLGKPAAGGETLDVLPLENRVAPVLQAYFQDVGLVEHPEAPGNADDGPPPPGGESTGDGGEAPPKSAGAEATDS